MVSNKWTSTMRAWWSPGLCWAAHIIAPWIISPWGGPCPIDRRASSMVASLKSGWWRNCGMPGKDTFGKAARCSKGSNFLLSDIL